MTNHSVEVDKTCTKCKARKPVSSFERRGGGRLGYQARCKACRQERRNQLRAENIDLALEREQRWCEANRDKMRDADMRSYYYRANILKGDATLAEVERIATYMRARL